MSSDYNERSWAIDLISEFKSFVRYKDLHIKEVSGERTIRTEDGSLFPDVLLHRNRSKSEVVQGWELKMPDTPVTNNEFIENATKKAEALSLNSFLLWNVDEAVLYIRDEEDYQPHKSWAISKVAGKRGYVESRKSEWVSMLHQIIRDLNEFFESGIIKESEVIESFSEHGFTEQILRGVSVNADHLERICQANALTDARVSQWWSNVQSVYDNSSKYTVLSKSTLTGWINKIVFANVLKRDFNSATLIENLTHGSSIEAAIDCIKSISDQCNFLNVFDIQVGENHVCGFSWRQILQLNDFLAETDVAGVDQTVLHNFLRSTTDESKRRAAGQFTTPLPLARILVGTTMYDRNAAVLDPCCGTGTIARAAYDAKVKSNFGPVQSFSQTWASDKFAYPLQVATLAMVQPATIGSPVRVFQSDVIDLHVGKSITLQDPSSGQAVKEKLPEFATIVSNLPFVQFENIAQRNPTIKQINKTLSKQGAPKVELSGKSDLYAYIPFYLWTLLSKNGRLGIIVSNSWLATGWGDEFEKELCRYFNIETVVVSKAGRWFPDADVVTSLIILEKKSTPAPTTRNYTTNFVSLAFKINNVQDGIIDKAINDIITSRVSKRVNVNTYKRKDIDEYRSMGLPLNALLSDVSWLHGVKSSLIKATDLFEMGRGERRGWNAMFYPESGHGIESQYIRKVLRQPGEIDSLVTTPQTDAFCCPEPIGNLKANGHSGALSWIKKFSSATNKKGEPLPQVLQRSGVHWYEMSSDTLADFVLPINPDKRLFFARLTPRSFVDQRFVRFTTRTSSADVGLYHALLNSVVSIFYQEALGFGRGLGVLDLSASKVKRGLRILDPSLVSRKEKLKIINYFDPLLKRPPLSIESELQDPDRIAFDKVVLEVYGLKQYYDRIKGALMTLYDIRKAAVN